MRPHSGRAGPGEVHEEDPQDQSRDPERARAAVDNGGGAGRAVHLPRNAVRHADPPGKRRRHVAVDDRLHRAADAGATRGRLGDRRRRRGATAGAARHRVQPQHPALPCDRRGAECGDVAQLRRAGEPR